jgi:hypothetical protein
MIPELNVGYGTTNPQKLLHLVENDVAIRLQDIRLENSSMGYVVICFLPHTWVKYLAMVE